MDIPERPVLQGRWQLRDDNGSPVLVYYGLRNPPRHTRQVITLDAALAELIGGLDGALASDLPSALTAHPQFLELVEDGVIVDARELRPAATRQSRRQCVRCVNDDYLLPGLEFDENGVCAFCQCYEASAKGQGVSGPQNIITEGELVERARANTESRFDAMVLCTGGKDSTYLLWLLSKKLGLRVLAAAWNMPYTNDACRENLQRAVRMLPSVELVERTLPWSAVRDGMREQFAESGLPCLCAFVAPVLLFPMALEERIPLILSGVEEVQMAVMSHVAQGGAASARSAAAPPKSQREQTLDYLGMLSSVPKQFPEHGMLSDYFRMQQLAQRRFGRIYERLRELLDRARQDPSLPVPEMRRLRTSLCYGSWRELETVIQTEAGWRMPPGHKGLLHTSCSIEPVKDYCQFLRFQNMRSTFFPQSIVELSAGVFWGMLTRDAALAELESLGYYSEPAPLSPLLEDLGISQDDISANRELTASLRCR